MSDTELPRPLAWRSSGAGMLVGVAYTLKDLVTVAIARGEPQRAAQLWGAAARLRMELGVPVPPHEQAGAESRRATIARALDRDTWTAQWAVGAHSCLTKSWPSLRPRWPRRPGTTGGRREHLADRSSPAPAGSP